MAAISIKPRSSDEWLVLIAALDQAIEAYCLAAGLPDDARVQLLAVRNRQSLASIPESLEWFRREVEALQQQSKQSHQNRLESVYSGLPARTLPRQRSGVY